MDDIENYAGKLQQKLGALPFLRDVQIQQPLKFPVIRIHFDRFKIAQMV